MKRIKFFLFILPFLVFLIACSSQAETKISFGGYHFNLFMPQYPKFIGGGVSLLIHFPNNKKLLFVEDAYSHYHDYGISVGRFVDVIFGDGGAEGNEQLQYLKDQLAIDEVRRNKEKVGDIMIYFIEYSHKKYAVIFDPGRTPEGWVTVEAEQMDLEKIVGSLKQIRK